MTTCSWFITVRVSQLHKHAHALIPVASLTVISLVSGDECRYI